MYRAALFSSMGGAFLGISVGPPDFTQALLRALLGAITFAVVSLYLNRKGWR